MEAGALRASIDRSGKPMDVHGTPYSISVNGGVLTASNAGTDRFFGTDDIEYSTSAKP